MLSLTSRLAIIIFVTPVAHVEDGSEQVDPLHEEGLPNGALGRLGSLHLRSGKPIRGMALSPDGQMVCTFSDYDGIRVWNLRTGIGRRQINERPTSDEMYFSPDGKLLYFGGLGGIVVYDTSSWQLKSRLPERSGPMGVRSIALSRNGEVLASAAPNADEPTIRIWNTRTGNELLTLRAMSTSGFAIALSGDGKVLAAGWPNGRIQAWEVTSGKPILNWKAHDGPVYSLASTERGELLASSGNEKAVIVWNLPTGTEALKLPAEQEHVSILVFSPDGRKLALARGDKEIQIHDIAARKEVLRVGGNIGTVGALNFTADGKAIAAGGNGAVHVWDVQSGRPLFVRKGHDSAIVALSACADGKTLASASKEHPAIRIWDVESRQETLQVQGPRTSTAIRHLSSLTIVAVGIGEAGLWDLSTGERIPWLESEKLDEVALSLACSSDKKKVAIGGQNLRLWDANKVGGGLLILGSSDKTCYGPVEFAPDGKHLAAGFGGFLVRCWDVERCKETGSIELASRRKPRLRPGRPVLSQIGALAFVADSSLLFAAVPDGTVRICDMSARKEILTLEPTDVPTLAIALSPNGSFLATGEEGGLIRLWEVRSGCEINSLNGHSEAVSSLTFLKGGRVLASGSEDSSILLWDVQSALGKCARGDGKSREELWRDMASTNAGKAYSAMVLLSSGGNSGVDFIDEQIRPLPAATTIKYLLDLEDEKADVRDQAIAGLTLAGGETQDLLKRALNTTTSIESRARVEAILSSLSPPVIRSPGRLRILRAIELLEWIGTSDAQRVLEKIVAERKGSLEASSAETKLRRSFTVK